MRTRSLSGPLRLLGTALQFNIIALFQQVDITEMTFPGSSRGYDPMQQELHFLCKPLLDRVCVRTRLKSMTVSPVAVAADDLDPPMNVPGFREPAFVQVVLQFEDHRMKRARIKVEASDDTSAPPRKRVKAARKTI